MKTIGKQSNHNAESQSRDTSVERQMNLTLAEKMSALISSPKDKYESILVKPVHGHQYKNYKHNDNRLNFLNSKSFKPSRKISIERTPPKDEQYKPYNDKMARNTLYFKRGSEESRNFKTQANFYGTSQQLSRNQTVERYRKLDQISPYFESRKQSQQTDFNQRQALKTIQKLQELHTYEELISRQNSVNDLISQRISKREEIPSMPYHKLKA